MRTTAIRFFLPLLPLFLLAAGVAPAQSLSPEVLGTLRASFSPDASMKAIQNAVTAQSVRGLALDRAVATGTNSYFSNKIKTEGITDQKSSGRCWLFAGLNLMRPVAMTSLNKRGFEFSQNYLTFYDKLEKANLFLEEIIRTRTRPLDDPDVVWLLKNPFPDGGQWNMVLALIEKYGVVPSDVMPETESSSNTGMMNGLVSTLLRKDAARLRDMSGAGSGVPALEQAKVGMLKDVYRMLCIHLGTPPQSFEWRYENNDGTVTQAATYTPLEFYRKYVNMKLDDYVCLYSVPAHPFNAVYQIRYDRNQFDMPNMTFANLPMETIKDLTLKSVLANEPVWFGCDVGKESDTKLGVMRLGLYDYSDLYGIDFSMSKKDRVLYQESIPSHAMVITGVDLVNGKPQKWLVENSWGTKAGNNGMFTMYDSWFDEYTYTVIINKKFLPQSVLALFDQKATELPPWDPMFAVGAN